ncbi:hypothetical protein OIU85_009428 [Salix viminalis]|uniref:Uncharacterized protein n=1 Tax=Salix viminalis TaxID=40686 RepID=A0A9Q0NUC9_SALVM|nr:hypothetical protein OIU85_009428 [Salix viminalis]
MKNHKIIEGLSACIHYSINLGDLSSSRHISRAPYEEKHRLNTEFSSPLPQHQPATAHTMKLNKDEKVKNLYAASHKLVPGGPNPLHN